MGATRTWVKFARNFIRRKDPANFVLQTAPSTLELLDKCSASDIQRLNKVYQKFLKFQWDYYSELEFQRSRVSIRLQEALSQNSTRNFVFEKWCRLVSAKWNNTPLSARGSLTDPGGRFNVGEIDTGRFPVFPALYLAQDQETSLQETLGQHPDPKTGLTIYDNALGNPTSFSIFSVSGMIENVFDLRDKDKLSDFCEIIKGFSIPNSLTKTCKELQRDLEIPLPRTVKTTKELLNSLLDPNWRVSPYNFDIPSNPQIFGQIIHASGIEGIVYPSKFTEKDCLTLFPENLKFSSSVVGCDDPLSDTVQIKELNSKTWQDCI